jgi:hypothetical protein
MNTTVTRRCEILDLEMPRGYMIKFDMVKENLMDQTNAFWVPNMLESERTLNKKNELSLE